MFSVFLWGGGVGGVGYVGGSFHEGREFSMKRASYFPALIKK